jgi:hydrogenase maturation protease
MTLIVGIGNPLRGDDGFGVALASAISGNFDTITIHQLTPEIVEEIRDYETIIFTDISYGLPLGAIACSLYPNSSSISHKSDLFDFVDFAKIYHQKEFDFYLFSSLSDQFEYTQDINSKLKENIHTISNYIKENFSNL